MSSAAAKREHMLSMVTPIVAAAGYELDDLVVHAIGRRSVVRLVVDRDGGIDLDAVADVSRAVSEALDADDPFGTPFTLEVTSPGVDRKLTEPRYWRRAQTRLVTVPVGGVDTTGRIVEVDEAGVVLDIAGTKTHHAWSELGAGRIQVEFNRRDIPDEALTELSDGQED